MIAVALAALFFCAGILAIGSIGLAISAALPKVRELKLALADSGNQRELRYTIREVVVTPAQASVVALPLRFKQSAPRPLRAAA